MKKTALVTGASGQDGSYLCEFLLSKGYRVVAGDRRSSRDNLWRHNYLGITKNLIYESIDLIDFNSILRLFKKFKFDEVYNLAAQSFVKESFLSPLSSSDSTAIGTLRLLEVIKENSPKVRFYQASSSEMFGKTTGTTQNEKTRFNPRSPYAIAKLFAHNTTTLYRDAYGIFSCNGILFNHESPLRSDNFVTKKIVKHLVEVKNKKRKCLELGNIYAKRDWGYAKDYVEAMWKILQAKKADDFVIATNKAITVKDFVNLTLKELGFEFFWRGKSLKEKAIDKTTGKILVKINKNFYRPAEVDYLKGNYNKAKKILKWKPKISIKKLVKLMVDFEINNI